MSCHVMSYHNIFFSYFIFTSSLTSPPLLPPTASPSSIFPGKTPGGNIGFENAPFKLTTEFVELMDGPRSHSFMQFRSV